MTAYPNEELPDHVRRIIGGDGEIEFTPPSFERWLGRLQMLRTMSAMGAFLLVWLVSYNTGMGWEDATIRAIIAALVFHFVAWAGGLFIFGEIYDAEIKTARVELEEKERERARRIESYYRERLLAQQVAAGEDPDGVPAIPPAVLNAVPPLEASPLQPPAPPQRNAA